jgi:hypothetical protein
VIVVVRLEFAATAPALAVIEIPAEPELCSADDVVTVAHVIVRLPEVVIAPEELVKAPDPPHVKERALVAVVLIAAETVMFPWLLRVALPIPNWL